MDTAEIIQRLMAQKEVKLADLSRATKVGHSTISSILSRTNEEPRDKTLLPIAAFFKVTIGQLRGYDKIPTLEGLEPQGFPVLESDLVKDWVLGEVKEPGGRYLASQYPKGPKTFVWVAADDSMYPVVPQGGLVFVDPEFKIEELKIEGMIIALIEKDGRFALRSEIDDLGEIVYKPINGDYRHLKSDECQRIGYVVGIPEKNWIDSAQKKDALKKVKNGT